MRGISSAKKVTPAQIHTPGIFINNRKKNTTIALIAPAKTFDHIQAIVITEAFAKAMAAFCLFASGKKDRYSSSNGLGLMSIYATRQRKNINNSTDASSEIEYCEIPVRITCAEGSFSANPPFPG